MMMTENNGVPRKIATPILKAYWLTQANGIDNYTTYQLEKLKEAYGSQYAHVPLDDIRRQAIKIRKSGVLGVRDGHAPSKRPETSEEYKEHLRSPEWKRFAETIKEKWEYRCAVCYSPDSLDLHHRTYANFRHERETDCIPLCNGCHKFADTRRKRQAYKGETVGLWNDE